MYRTKRRPPSARLASRFARLRNFTSCLACAGLAASALTLAASGAGNASHTKTHLTETGRPAAAFDGKTANGKTADKKTAPTDAGGEEALKPSASYGRLPLAFEPNRGQADPHAEFVARGEGYRLTLAAGEAVLALRGASESLRMKAVGADTSARGVGLGALAGVSNYFTGGDPSRWLTRVPHFARVRYAGVYEGVDLEYYGNGRRLEYDFRVAAGADAARIALAFDGARRLKTDANGDLLISPRGGGDVRLLKPFAYQEDENGARTEVAARYIVEGGRVRFRLGAYDRSRALVIDPCVEYATFLGGALDDRVLGVAVDAQGHAYVAGLTTSADFHVVPTPPTPLPNPTPTPPPFISRNGLSDAFVSKLSDDGSTLLWSTYFGGSGNDDARGIAVDAQGNAYITGVTDSSDLPTVNAFQPSKGSANAFIDAYVAKIRADGAALEYSTYLGGWRPDIGQAVAVDASGAAYVTGNTGSYDTGSASLRTFPVTAGAYQTDFPFLTEGGGNSAAFVTKLSPAGALAYSTFLGGLGRASGSTNGDADPDDTGFGIAINASGEAYVTGRTESERFPATAGAAQPSYSGGLADAFVTRLDASGSSLLYSTFLGGSNEEDRSAGAVALDPSGNVYLTGTTSSANFPTLNPVTAAYSGSVESDAYATKLSNAGAFVYSTYLGTNNFRRGFGVAADPEGNAYVVGSNALRKLDAAGALVLPSRTLGGEGRGVALDADGNVYVGGITTTTAALKCTSATQFCPTAGAFQQNPGGSTNDGFVLKFEGEEDEVEIAGFTFPRAALADDAFQTKVGIDASAQFCSRVDYAGTTIAQRVKSALTDGCPATSTLGDAEFEADFVDNRVVNLPGADLAVFEIGSGSGNEPFSVSAFNPAQNAFTSAVTYTPQPTTYFDCANLRINVALIDLDDFGVAPGAYVTRLRFDNLFVPNVVSSGAEIADIAAVHSAPPNRAPVADAGPDQTFTAAPGLVIASLDGSHSSDPDGDALAYEWRNDANLVVSQDAAFTDFVHSGVNTYTLKVTDPYGLSSTDTVTVTVNPPDDDGAPVTVAVPSTPANGAGWHNADLSVALHATDDAGGSGVKQVTYSASGAQAIPTTTVGGDSVNIPFSAEGTTTITFFAEDNAGNVEQAKTFVVRLDKTAPSVNAARSPAANGQGWNNTDVTASYTAADALSGLASPASGSFVFNTEGANQSHTFTVSDVAGNTASATVSDVNIDKSAPAVVCGSPDGQWHGSDVSIQCTATGGDSGLADAADASFTLSTHVPAGTEDANASTGSRQVCDAAGNCSTAGPISGNKVDKKAPTFNCDGPDGLWHGDNVGLVCTASDGGSGVSGPNTATLTTNVAAGGEDANASTGSHVFTDAVGNSATAGPIAGNKVDRKSPSVGCGSPDGLWHNADVSIPCTAADGGSGLASASDASFALTTSVPVGTEDSNASTGSRQVCDAVGHCSTAGPVAGNKVDRKAPDINLVAPAQGASYTVGQAAAASYNCSDGGSGVVACVGSAANGGAIDTSSVGAKSFTVTAADAVGNVSTKTVTYFVGYGVCALYDQTKAYKSGSTIPVKLRLCGANGENLSAAGLTVTALGTVRLSDFAPGEVEDAGQANPDDNFRFAGDGYIFNLQTKGLTTGTYVLAFKAGSDPLTHGVQFQIK
jgi:hypothetical protein